MLSAEKAYERRWYTLAVLCMSLIVITVASLLLTAGALCAKYGRKGALTVGLLLFGGCSGLASLATTPEMLIVARGLMGIGAALIFPTTLSILTNTFTGRERATAIGVWAGV